MSIAGNKTQVDSISIKKLDNDLKIKSITLIFRNNNRAVKFVVQKHQHINYINKTHRYWLVDELSVYFRVLHVLIPNLLQDELITDVRISYKKVRGGQTMGYGISLQCFCHVK